MGITEEPDDRTASTARHVRPGAMLLSSVDLVEPTFRRTVIYMIEHNEAGSLGVVLNRPSDTPVRAVLPEWADLAAAPARLHVGGPVKRDSALCLATIRQGVGTDLPRGVRRVDGRVVMIDLDSDPRAVASLVDGVRVFAGYSGWSLGQLDGELQRKDWMVLDGCPADVMGPPHRDLWAHVLRRQPLPLAMLATHPVDVARN